MPGVFVGTSPTQDGLDPLYADGYLSDLYVYFVDGHALEPTDFGAMFPADPSEPNRRWGPLDSTVVIDNINNYVPTPDAGPNYEQKWSDGLEFPGGQYTGGNCKLDAGFNGDTGNGVCAEPNGSVVICNFSPAISGELEIWSRGDSVTLNRTYILTDDDATRLPIVVDKGSAWIKVGSVSNLTKLEVTGDSPGGGVIDALKLDGRLLIDGPADQSQMWSEQVTPILPTNLNGPVSDLLMAT